MPWRGLLAVALAGSTALSRCGSSQPSPERSRAERRSEPERVPAGSGAAIAPAAGSSVAPGAASSGPAAPLESTGAEPERTRVKRRCVIAALGDSLTDERVHGGGYLNYVARRCPESRIDNFAKGGAMVNQ